jgi:hypothetical protein
LIDQLFSDETAQSQIIKRINSFFIDKTCETNETFRVFLAPLYLVLISSHTGFNFEFVDEVIKNNHLPEFLLTVWRLTASIMTPNTKVLVCPLHKYDY